MTKSELKNGMGVVHRNGDIGFVIRDCHTNHHNTKDFIVYPSGGFNRLNEYDNNLNECEYHDSEWDIVKVLQFNTTTDMLNVNVERATVLWERKEKKSLTLEEVEKLLGYPVEIVTNTPPTDEPHKYKVGDKVVTTKLEDYSGCELFPVGTVCTISNINPGGKLPYKLRTADDYWYYSEDMFKPYKEV